MLSKLKGMVFGAPKGATEPEKEAAKAPSTFSSTWQRHKAKACTAEMDCFYCKREEQFLISTENWIARNNPKAKKQVPYRKPQ